MIISDGATGAEFLSPDQVERMLRLTRFPKAFKGITGYGGPRGINYPGNFKHRYTSQAQRYAIAPERLLEIQGGALLETADAITVSAATGTPYVPRGRPTSPIFANQAVNVLNLQVPVGYQMWISGYAFNLFPNQMNELNYFWQLRIDGMDMLNKGGPMQPGRPIQSAAQVTIGRDKSQMFLAQQGSVIQVVVMAINTLGASDSVSASIFGQLEGLQS